LSLGNRGLDGAISTAMAYRLILQKSNKKTKPLLETSVVLAQKILQFYRLALNFPLINSTFAFNNNELIDALYLDLGVNPVRAVKAIPKYYAYGDIERAIFCINSFKGELLNKVKIFDKTAQFITTRFKRLYKDRGFSYNEYVDNQDFRRALIYSSAFGGKSTVINLLMQIGYLR
jgi:hypothetical protein